MVRAACYGVQVMLRTTTCWGAPESLTVIWLIFAIGASPVTEKPCPDAAIVVGVMTPTVPETENDAVYGGVPPVMTKFDVAVLHNGGTGAGGGGGPTGYV